MTQAYYVAAEFYGNGPMANDRVLLKNGRFSGQYFWADVERFAFPNAALAAGKRAPNKRRDGTISFIPYHSTRETP